MNEIRFEVRCTITDIYSLRYDKKKYPDIVKHIYDKYENDPFEAETAGICTIDMNYSGKDPDTDMDTLDWRES